MRRLTAIFVGILLLMAITPAIAEAPPIKLIVNGREVAMDVAPVNIDGRVYVPARYVAEPLGATVEWDAANNAVVITSQEEAAATITPTPPEPQVRTQEVKSAKVGDVLQFGNFSVTVTDVRYTRDSDGFVASDGKVVAVVSLSISTGNVSVDPLRNAVSLIRHWYLESGASVSQSFAPTLAYDLWPNQELEAQIGTYITENDSLKAIRISSPYPEDRWTQYQVELD